MHRQDDEDEFEDDEIGKTLPSDGHEEGGPWPWY